MCSYGVYLALMAVFLLPGNILLGVSLRIQRDTNLWINLCGMEVLQVIFFTLCCVFCIRFSFFFPPIVYTKAEIKFLCIRLEFNAAFIFLASKSLTQGFNSMTKPTMVAVVPPSLSFLIRTFLLVPSSPCTAIRFILLRHQKSPLP